jgi:hypothetical protein
MEFHLSIRNPKWISKNSGRRNVCVLINPLSNAITLLLAFLLTYLLNKIRQDRVEDDRPSGLV